MTHRPRRGLSLALTTVLILSLAAATATGAESAAALFGQQKELALSFLRLQLGDGETHSALPASLALVIAQSPLLLSSRDAILELRRSEERDDPEDTAPSTLDDATTPIPETPTEPDAPLVIADNGVPARTLIPSSPEGYTLLRDVYIRNQSDCSIPAGLSAGTSFALTPGAQPQVLILHTHGSEAYTMPPGEEYLPSSEYRTTDERYNVVRVGDEIAAVLEQAGIAVLHDRTLHDHPQYSGAYNRSLVTAEEYLEQYPSIQLVLDIHRDAVSDGNGNMYKVVSAVAGMNAAQMSFVVGTDGGGLSHPTWERNLALAAAVQETLLRDYPTLMRPITVRNSRYNQHLGAGSLLVEMGAAGNSLDEALFSARLLAGAIVETLTVSADKPLPTVAVN